MIRTLTEAAASGVTLASVDYGLQLNPAYQPNPALQLNQAGAPWMGQQEPQTTVNGPDCMCEQLTVLAVFLLNLRDQAHLEHLAYNGRDFISIHPWLKEQYDLHLEQFDKVAEFIRIYRATLPGSVRELRAVIPNFMGEACLCDYLSNIEQLISMATALERTAVKARAIDVANYMAQLVDEAGKTAWFLRMTLGMEPPAGPQDSAAFPQQ